MDRGLVDQAVANFEKAIQMNPAVAENYVALAAIEDSRGNWQRAEQLIQQALQIHPDDPFAASNLADLLLEHGGSADSALSYAQIARQGLPESPVTADALGWAYCQKGAYSLAVNLLEEAVRKAPDEPNYRYHLGMTYMKVADRAHATEHLQRALKLSPTFAHADEIKGSLSKLSLPLSSERH